MKKIIALAYLLSLPMMAQDNEKACDIFSKINTLLQQRHYQPKPIDDSLSVYIFNTVMEGLDDNRTLFLLEDYDFLARHKYNIDEYIAGKNCDFFNDFLTTYKTALERNKKYLGEISNETLQYNTKDSLYFTRKVFKHLKDTEKIKKFLRKKITYEILEDISKSSKNKDSLSANFAAISKSSKTKIINAMLCRTNTMLNPDEGFDASMQNRFFSVFCSYFDPHSTYFNYNEKSSFESAIATNNYSLGIYVSQNEKEEIIVEEIVPGGPAHKTGKLSKGDQLIKVGANANEYLVSCESMETINSIVLSDSYKKVELTLRKNDGTIYSVDLEKTVMKADDHSVYSFIMGDEDPVGYIKIPSFYTAFDNEYGKGCADDVAKEITKLKKDNITGLIIDLQFNGGGSMEEVIRLAGMFIDVGPLSVYTGKGKEPTVIKDYVRGTLYTGPLVVLVNGFSASASEFFAGVMQDYNRALIAGSTTVGKATMQMIFPLDENNRDFVKVTVDKFYRVTGKSSQYTGIVPDVEMPSYFEKFQPRESSMPMALKNDSINYNVKFRQLPGGPIKQSAELSKKRIAANSGFSAIRTINTNINLLYDEDKPPLPLTFSSIFDNVHSIDGIWEAINDAADKENDLKVTTSSYTSDILVYDDFQKSINDYKIKSIKTDPYIYESLHIIRDLYTLKNK